MQEQAGKLNSSDKLNLTGGSVVDIVFPAGGTKSITDTSFKLSGGVLYIDPPGSNNVTISGATITATGTPLSGGGGGGGGGGSGNGGGLPTVGSTGLSGQDGSSTALQLEVNANLAPALNTATGNIITGRDNLGELNSENAASLLPDDTTNDAINQAAIYCLPAGVLKTNDKSDKDSWILAANKCQPFSFETADGSIIIGSGPAEFMPGNNHTLLLRQGKLLVIAGQSTIVVRTPMCNVTVPVNSASTVEFNTQGMARLTSLAGGCASISLTRRGETMILSAAPGEQVILAESAVPDSQISCQPPVNNTKVDTWMVRLDGVRGQKFSFDRTEMVAQEGLLNCSLGCFTKVQQSMIDQIRKSMLLEHPKELKSLVPVRPGVYVTAAPDAAGHLKPVGFGKVLDLTVPTITTLTCKTATVKYSGDAAVGINKPDALSIKRGDAIVTASAPTDISLGSYNVHLTAGTIVMVSNRGDHVIVRDIYETRRGTVNLTTPDNRVLVEQVGQELIVGKEGFSYSAALGADAVGRRCLHSAHLGKASTTLTFEVSLVSLLQNTDTLSQLTRSQAPEDKAMIAKIEKMAVVLSVITRGHGNYSMMGP